MQAGPGLPDEASNANQPKGQVPGGAGGDFAAGISGGVPFNHLWPVVAGGGGMKDEALDLALEALGMYQAAGFGNSTDFNKQHEAFYKAQTAITAIKQARALDKKAENARELGLDYEPVGLIDRLTNPEDHYEFTDPKKANAVLMSLCQEAADALAAQPTIPDAMTSADIQEHIEYVAGWNDCRQAMLKGMKP
jgi:hypothetical protein